jgi:hypothetical protein
MNLTVTQRDHAGPGVDQTRVEPENNAPCFHSFLCVASERFAELRQNAIARMDKHYAEVFSLQLGIICQNPVGVVVQGASKFHTGETASGDYERKQCPAAGGVSVRALEHFDHVIADTDSVEQTLEIERIFLQIHHPQIVGDGTERENEVIVGNLSDWRRLRRHWITRQENAPTFQINT